MTESRNNRFDPTPGHPYGECVTCALTLATGEDASRHRAETRPAGSGSSHTTRATNPTREERIDSWVNGVVGDAIEDAVSTLEGALLAGAATSEEIAEALKWHSGFGGAWENRA